VFVKGAQLLTVGVSILLVATAIPVAGALTTDQVVGSPDLSLSVSDNRFAPTERGQLTVQVTNNGDILRGGPAQFEQRVQTARNVRFEVLDERVDAPIEIKSGPAVVGTLPQGASQVRFAIELGDVDPGEYQIPIEVQYSYTRSVTYDAGGANPEYNDLSRTETLEATIVVERTPQFTLTTDRTRNLYVGDTGQLELSIRNTGTESATDATATLTSQTRGLFFGAMASPSPSTNVFVDELAPGETRDISVKIGATDDLSQGEYPVELRVRYSNQNDVTEQSDPLTAGVTVGPERQFSLRNVSTENLQVGQSGATVTGELVNTGEVSAENTVLRLTSTGAVTPTAPESAVGTLEPGERQPVRFTVSVAPETEPGSRVLTFVAEYENEDSDIRTTDPLRQSVDITNELTFELRNVETGNLRVGESNIDITGDLTNTGDTTAHNAVAQLQSASAIQVTGQESAVGDLEPGETQPVQFRVAVPEDAEPGARSLTFGVEYENANGDLKQNLSPIRQSVQVEPDRDVFSVVNISTDITAGGSDEVAVTIVNNGETRVADATARLFVNDPLSSSDNSAFLGTLAPGEQQTATFRLSAGGSAIAKDYQASIEVRYQDTDGDSRLADGLSIGIPVAESSGGLPIPFIALGAGMVLLGGGLFVYRRRDV
jgi:hypothetical protein